MSYVANARMYSIKPAAAHGVEGAVWLAPRKKPGVDLRRNRSCFSAPLSELWSCPDPRLRLSCAGFSYALYRGSTAPSCRARFRASAIIPGRPVYATRLIVRADSKFSMLEADIRRSPRLRGTRPCIQVYNALRHHLLPYYRHRGAGLL